MSPDSYLTLCWGFFVLLAFVIYEWHAIAPKRERTACDKHPGSSTCVHRDKSYNRKKEK